MTSNKWVTFLIVAVGVFMSTLDASIVNISLPRGHHKKVPAVRKAVP